METIKQLKKILYEQKVVVLTNHNNLTYDTTNHASNRFLCQQLLLKEYGVEIHYIKGVKNVVANALSQLPIEHNNQTTQEAFLNCRIFKDKVAFLLDLQRITDAQLTDKKCNKYKQNDEFLTVRSPYSPHLL